MSKKMNQMKISYQNQLKEQKQKFDGLEILCQNLYNKKSTSSSKNNEFSNLKMVSQ